MEQHLETAFKSIAAKEGICDYEIKIVGGSLKGDGYVGNIAAVDIINKDKRNLNKILSLIVKSAPNNPAIRSKLKVEIIFDAEIHAYKIFGIFDKFEIERGLIPSKIAPKFYYAGSEYNKEFLILENIKTQKFKQHDTAIPLDKNHTRLVMAQYGRLHALSFALRDQQPKKFNELLTTFDIFLFVFTTLENSYMTSMKKALETLNPATELEAVQAVTDFINNIKLFLDEITASNNGEYTAFLHGDCWMNNLMFKYDDEAEPEKPTEVRFYDYQVTRAAMPVLDLVYFFYGDCAVEEYDLLDEYLNIYYESFCAHVRKLGSDPIKLYPFNVLKEQWKKYAKFSLIVTSLALQVMSPEGKKNTADLAKVAESEEGISSMFIYESSSNEMFTTRIRAIIFHLLKNKFL